MSTQPTLLGIQQAIDTQPLQVRRTSDMNLVRSLIINPEVYPWVTDDGSPAVASYMPIPANGDIVLYVLVEQHGVQGIFAFFQQNAATTEVHACVQPSRWGRTEEAARAAIDWVFSNTAYVRIVCSAPDDNPLAARLAIKAGMTQYGYNPNSFLRHGRLLGVDLYGISKEAICQLEQ